MSNVENKIFMASSQDYRKIFKEGHNDTKEKHNTAEAASQ